MHLNSCIVFVLKKVITARMAGKVVTVMPNVNNGIIDLSKGKKPDSVPVA